MVGQVVAHHGVVPGGHIGWQVGNFDQSFVDNRDGAEDRQRLLRFLFGIGERRGGEGDGRAVQVHARDAFACDDLHFDASVDLGADVASPGVDLVCQLDRVDVHARTAGGRTREELEIKGGNHSEEARTGPACGPVQIGMVFRVAVDLFAARGDHVESNHVLARQTPDAAVPAVAALKQIAADADTLAVAGGKEQILGLQLAHEHAAALPRSDDGGGLVGVDRRVVDALHVEQQGAVTEMVGRPAVPARPDADLEAVGPGVAQRADDVVDAGCHDDHFRIALGDTLVPHGAAASGFIRVVAAEIVPTCR